MLVSERVGQFFLHSEDGRDRVEYTEYGAGDSWVVLVHAPLLTRRMHEPLARALAASGLHVVVPDLLGHGSSDRPADPLAYSVEAFGEHVVALLDHLGAPQAVLGGTSLGANVALEVAVSAPERVRGLLVEAPVLDNALEAGLLAASPLLLTTRVLPFTLDAARLLSRPVPRSLLPFWAGVAVDVLDQRSGPTAALLHGLLFGRLAPRSRERRQIAAPTLVVGHPRDPLHPTSDADLLASEVPGAELVRARGVLEWRLRPERLTNVAIGFCQSSWRAPSRRRRAAGR
jgi:pimeloyl-ACP methyl ester carboxylesterase